MWFNLLNHKDNKDWIDRQLTEHAPAGLAHVRNDPTATSVGEAIQMRNPGYGWEDGTILTVHPDGRALVRWASGSTTTVPKRKIAHALLTAHVTEMSPAGVTRDPEERQTSTSGSPPRPQPDDDRCKTGAGPARAVAGLGTGVLRKNRESVTPDPAAVGG